MEYNYINELCLLVFPIMTSMAKWWQNFSDLKRSRGKISQPSYRLQIEPLEERALLSTDTWTGGGGANTNWSNPANWDQGTPNPGGDLNFPGTTGLLNPYDSLINDFPIGTTFHSRLA